VRATNGLYSSHDKRVLVGLGTATQVDAVTIVWPNGEVQTLERPAIDRYHEVIERFETR
jgi:hypothetical protein